MRPKGNVVKHISSRKRRLLVVAEFSRVPFMMHLLHKPFIGTELVVLGFLVAGRFREICSVLRHQFTSLWFNARLISSSSALLRNVSIPLDGSIASLRPRRRRWVTC